MSKKRNIPPLAAAALTVALLAGCAGDSPSDIAPTPSADNTEIKVNANVWQMMEGTRATTYDSPTAIQQEGSFTCTAYAANTATEHFVSKQVNWNPTAMKWEFVEPQKWPDNSVSYSALDFFAYMPATKPAYLTTGPTYAVIDSNSDGTPDTPQASFTCTLPADQSTLKEFVWTLITGQTQAVQGSTGVALHFTHPFARVRFVLSPESGAHVTVTSVTISGVKSTGTCTFDGTTTTWSDQNNAATFGGLVGTDYIAVPQTFAGSTQTVTVEATWEEWTGGVTKTFSTNVTMAQWEAGKSYTYTLTLQEYALKVSTDKYTEQW